MLHWLGSTSGVASPIIGFSSVEGIDEALEARGKDLTLEEEQYLEELYEARKGEGHQ
jgi:aryl-alcohol dehydrogenase-like predicted oxidoreductase